MTPRPALERSLSLCSHAQLFAAKSKKRKQVVLCDLCKKTKHPAISAAKLGHESCLITAYRDLGVFNERDDYGATPTIMQRGTTERNAWSGW